MPRLGLFRSMVLDDIVGIPKPLMLEIPDDVADALRPQVGPHIHHVRRPRLLRLPARGRSLKRGLRCRRYQSASNHILILSAISLRRCSRRSSGAARAGVMTQPGRRDGQRFTVTVQTLAPTTLEPVADLRCIEKPRVPRMGRRGPKSEAHPLVVVSCVHRLRAVVVGDVRG
jgi:hypothetical protein